MPLRIGPPEIVGILGILLVVVGVVGAIYFLRIAVLWYWRINELIDLQREQRDLLKYLVSAKEFELSHDQQP